MFNDSETIVLTHELGHALFNLADEYSERGQTVPKIVYPNCAPNKTTARTWWEDLEVQIDPYIKEVEEILNPRNIYEQRSLGDPSAPSYDSYIKDYVDFHKVGYYPGGCSADFGIESGATIPIPNSIMNNPYNAPFFGLVNSRRSIRFLAYLEVQIKQ